MCGQDLSWDDREEVYEEFFVVLAELVTS